MSSLEKQCDMASASANSTLKLRCSTIPKAPRKGRSAEGDGLPAEDATWGRLGSQPGRATGAPPAQFGGTWGATIREGEADEDHDGGLAELRGRHAEGKVEIMDGCE